MDHVKRASITDTVKEYYGRVLKTSADLKTSACCLAETLPPHLLAVLKDVHDEVKDRFYGCGTPIPPALEGITVLDLGCGSGRDCYVLSRLVGARGRVIGLDMTDEQLAVARRHVQWHADRFGHKTPNTDFRQGYIEDLTAAGVADGSVDLVVSNCVLNLSPDKARVFREIFRVLRPGGELYFSDIFSDRRIPVPLTRDPALLGECLGGALYIEDFRRLVSQAGCLDARIVSSSRLELGSPEIQHKIGFVGFQSMTIRAFKLPLEDRCEDFGQVATYTGTVSECPHAFDLDDHHRFLARKPMLVCGNTADMLTRSRYAPHFRVQGDKSVHFGFFDSGPSKNVRTSKASVKAGCC